MQNMSAGVFRFFAKKYRSLYAYNNTAMEACAGQQQNFYFGGSNKDMDGYNGKELIKTFCDHHMVKRAILYDKVAAGSISEAVKSGKEILKDQRNLKINERKAQQLASIDANGRNTVLRQVRVGEYDEHNKISFKMVTLQPGDTMPPKASKRIRDDHELESQIVKKLTLKV